MAHLWVLSPLQGPELVVLSLSLVGKLEAYHMRKFLTVPGSFLLSDNQGYICQVTSPRFPALPGSSEPNMSFNYDSCIDHRSLDFHVPVSVPHSSDFLLLFVFLIHALNHTNST